MRNKKPILSVVLLTVIIAGLSAQSEAGKEDKSVEVKWSGFVKNAAFYDSRRMFDALDGLLIVFPLPEDLDHEGNDLNASPNLGLLSLASRLRANISGPDAFGAVTSGYMEFDFTARANTASARFRQAWIRFNWGNTDLLVGRTWTPFVSTDVLPEVVGMNIGLPFQPFNRSDQLTVTQKAGNIHFILSAFYQNDYVNNGPLGRSASYQINSILPNLHAQVKYKTESTILGIAADYKRLKPRQFTVSPTNSEKYKSEATLACPALLAFLQINKNNFTFRTKSILAANASENIMTGAFAISSLDQQTGGETYTPYRHWFIWGDIRYGKSLRAGVFGGYLRNLGATDNVIAPGGSLPLTVFGLGENIGRMFRVSPSVSYTSGKVMVAGEIEHNIAAYGEFDYGNKGKVINTKNTSSTRLLASMYYFF